jgi:hypothetical protein
LFCVPACVLPDPAQESETGASTGPTAEDESTGVGESGDDSTSEGSESSGEPPAQCDFEVLADDVLTDTTVAANCTVHVPEMVRVGSQATLTLQAGARLQFAPGAGLEVGVECSDPDCTGSLRVEGTADAPVVLTSDSPSPGPGNWAGVRFGTSVMNGARIEGAIVEYAGEGQEGAVRFADTGEQPFGRVAIVDSVMRNNAAGGLTVKLDRNYDNAPGPFFAELAGNDFADDPPYAASLDPAAVDSVGPGNTFAGAIEVEQYQRGITRAVTWTDLGVPYVLRSGLKVTDDTGTASLTLTEGVQMRFMPGTTLTIGSLTGPGALHATGVTFDSAVASPAPGDWDGLWFDGDIAPSTITGCTITHARGDGPGVGDYDGVITLQQGETEDAMPSLSITDTVFVDNGGELDIFAEIGPGGPADCDKYVGAAAENTFDLTPCL